MLTKGPFCKGCQRMKCCQSNRIVGAEGYLIEHLIQYSKSLPQDGVSNDTDAAML